jgi:hypothetical protein
VWLHGSQHNYGSVTVRMETQDPETIKNGTVCDIESGIVLRSHTA